MELHVGLAQRTKIARVAFELLQKSKRSLTYPTDRVFAFLHELLSDTYDGTWYMNVGCPIAAPAGADVITFTGAEATTAALC